jgi:hypothetical protein
MRNFYRCSGVSTRRRAAPSLVSSTFGSRLHWRRDSVIDLARGNLDHALRPLVQIPRAARGFRHLASSLQSEQIISVVLEVSPYLRTSNPSEMDSTRKRFPHKRVIVFGELRFSDFPALGAH